MDSKESNLWENNVISQLDCQNKYDYITIEDELWKHLVLCCLIKWLKTNIQSNKPKDIIYQCLFCKLVYSAVVHY